MDPERRTEIVSLSSGREVRNALWAGSRRRWTIGGAISSLDALNELVRFFEARKGPLHGFRFRDFSDDRSVAPQKVVGASDQSLGVGDGARTVFELVKHYGETKRRIYKPVGGTVRVSLNGVEQTSGFEIDTTLGRVVFDAPPGAGVIVASGFRFDCPARFGADQIEANLEAFSAGRFVSIPIVEIVG